MFRRTCQVDHEIYESETQKRGLDKRHKFRSCQDIHMIQSNENG